MPGRVEDIYYNSTTMMFFCDCLSQVPGLHLPAPNPFVPSDLSMRPAPPGPPDQGSPEVLLQSPQMRVMHRTELRFGAPKVSSARGTKVVWLGFRCFSTP